MNRKLQDGNMDFLFKAIMKLESLEECYDFFEDICTVQELKSIAQRLKVAKLLTQKHVYNYIVEKTGASTATISRVNRTLNYGNDGYKVIFGRLAESGTELPE
ncbi:MAG: TrpR-like protein, YerC/YecD [Oscillospiraceae bacterium]|nr:TrpR-like protein, YerC/YecD [Oscillospiraceae bacterium]